ncbi:class I SAM-dependent methyltransferase [Myxococcus xanthus]|uniref:class I SAM-dependent methyltransferase n=1 Tax=Myxococcus xanthus TaxID=34 RepID=UPI00112657A4|nr:class I SAM-dependent methyltransferase [Myxococcus xanthus]QDE95810.1 methyltransferase [Myxococcus xanthus]
MTVDRRTLAQSLHFWARNASNESALLRTALSLGLFDALPVKGGAPPVSMTELARRIQCTHRGTRALTELLVCLGFVHLDDARELALIPTAAAFLRDVDFRKRLEAQHPWWDAGGRLDEAVKQGGPVAHGGASWDVLGHYRALFLTAPAPGPSPEAEDFFDRFARSALRMQVLLASGRLGLLEALSSQAHTEQTLGATTGLGGEGLSLLVALLEQLGIAQQEGATWRLTDEARQLLDGKALPYLLRSLSVSEQYWEALGRLDETVREERFILDLKDPEVSQRFYADNSSQITAVFASHFQLSRRAAATVAQARALEGAQVLDIGTGSGVWGAAFARATPTTHVTYFDQAVVLEQVRRNVEALKVSDRSRFWPGNLFTQDFGEADFDLIILPQVLNVLRPEDLPGMFARVARALRPGGVLVIAEYVLDERRDGPLDHLYFGLRRFMTNEGDLLSASEYGQLLADVGLSSSVCIPLPTQELVLAARPGVPLPTTLAPPPDSSRKSAA